MRRHSLNPPAQQMSDGAAFKDAWYQYNPLGRMTKVTDPAGWYTVNSYDSNGRPVTAAPTTGCTTYTYWDDAQSKPTNFVKTATTPDGAVVRTGVDTASGDVRYTISPDQEVARAANSAFTATFYTRDATSGNVLNAKLNRYAAGANLDAATPPTPTTTYTTTSYEYWQSNGWLLQKITDPLGHFNRLTSITGKTEYVNDRNGNILYSRT